MSDKSHETATAVYRITLRVANISDLKRLLKRLWRGYNAKCINVEKLK